MTRVVCKFPAVPEVVVWDHGRKNRDNVMLMWHVVIFNYVEFTQGKLRIARDTTVNDYFCCNGVKCLGPSFTLSSWQMTRVICQTMRGRECKLFISSVTCRFSPNQWIMLLTMLIFNRHLWMSHTAVPTPGTLRLLLDRSVAWPKVGDYLARDTGRWRTARIVDVTRHTTELSMDYRLTCE